MQDFELFKRLQNKNLYEASMSKKHFRAVADTIKRGVEAGGEPKLWQQVANDLASLFIGFNPRFDKNRFIDACGLTNLHPNPSDEETFGSDDEIGDELDGL